MKFWQFLVAGTALALAARIGCHAETPDNVRERLILHGPPAGATGVAFSPDGRRLLTGAENGVATVWDLDRGRALLAVPVGLIPIWSVAYAPDGKSLLVGAEDKPSLWDAETGHQLQTYPARQGTDWVERGVLRVPTVSQSRIEAVAFSPDGRWVLSGAGDGTVCVWETATGGLRLRLLPRGGRDVHAAAFSPDGLGIAIADYAGRLSFWDALSGTELSNLVAHTNAIESLAFFPDGRRLVTGSYDCTARVWEFPSGRELITLRGHRGAVMCVAVSPEGRWMATGGIDGTGRLWNANDGQLSRLLQGSVQPLDGIAFSPEGRRVAATSSDGTVRLWELPEQPEARPPTGAIPLRLETGYFPLAFQIAGDPERRQVRSIRVTGMIPREGDGDGHVLLDVRSADLSAFGDVGRRHGSAPALMPVVFRHVATGGGSRTNISAFDEDAPASRGFRLYELALPSGAMAGGLYLVLGTATLGPHRLLVAGPEPASPSEPRRRAQKRILPLRGEPSITSILPDLPLGKKVQVEGYYTGLDGRVRRLEIDQAAPNGESLTFDPNDISFDAFGEPVRSTLMGYTRHPIRLLPGGETDPSVAGRRLYWVVSDQPADTNRVALVLGRSRGVEHRVLLFRGSEIAIIVPAYDAERRCEEVRMSGPTARPSRP